MSSIIAEVLTNCEDDKYRRVKLKALNVWEKESDLIPALNGIYLEKGDTVLVDIEGGITQAFIRGKILTDKQLKNSPQGEGVVIYEAKNGSKWVQLRCEKGNFLWSNSDGVKVTIKGRMMKIEGTLKLTVDSKVTDIVGATATAAIPFTSGNFNCIPNCPMLGVPHGINQNIKVG